MRRKSGTSVGILFLRILRQEQFTSHATEWGIKNESCALQVCQAKQRENGHPELVVCKSGFTLTHSMLFLELALMVLCMIHHHLMSRMDF